MVETANLNADIESIAGSWDGHVYVCDHGLVLRYDDTIGLREVVIPQSDSLSSPSSITVDRDGVVWVADTRNHRVLRAAPNGPLAFFPPEVIAGNGAPGSGGDGGSAAQAQLNSPNSLAVDVRGVVTVGDAGNSRLRRLIPNGAGGYTINSLQVGNGTGGLIPALFNNLRDVEVDFQGRVYVAADASVRRIDPRLERPTIDLIAGVPGQPRFSRDGAQARTAKVYAESIAIDDAENIYLAEGAGNRIRVVSGATGIISTLAGRSAPGNTDGAAIAATFNNPNRIAVDPSGRIYVIDSGNRRIRIIK